jgi:formylglycine-generating enzyme required for sulfatase activity
MGKNPSAYAAYGSKVEVVRGLDTKRFPVEQVSWDDAVTFCRTLSGLPLDRQAGRLPRANHHTAESTTVGVEAICRRLSAKVFDMIGG